MKDQFEVWRFDFGKDKGGEHPAILISHPDICARSKVVNVLYCTSQRQSRQPHPHEVLLNGADGMDWETFVDCSVLWSVEAAKLFGKRGLVTPERRRAIRSKVRDLFLLNAAD